MSRIHALLQRKLVHRCTITAADSVIRDTDNQPIPGSGTPVANIPCRLTEINDAERINARNGDTVLYTDAILLPRGTAIGDQSVVTTIEGRDPATGSWIAIDGGPFDVIEVNTRYSNEPEYTRALINRAG